MASQSLSTVAIIGAGPVGLFSGLLVAQAGIDVVIFEAEEAIVQSVRALAYFPVVLNEFKKAGIFDDVLEAGQRNSIGVSWRKADGTLLAHLGGGPPDQFAIHLGQPELAAIILKHLEKHSHVRVVFNTCFKRAEQTDGKVWSFLEQGPEKKPIRHVSQYLVGADGGKSMVRRSAGIQLEGFTWDDFQFIAANIIYNLEGLSDWPTANYIVDPEDWAIVAKTGKGDNWRVASGVRMANSPFRNDWDRGETVTWLRDKFKRILPGPTEEIEIVSVAPYIVHQRCASRFVDGNILLAGDAAHLNNPVGGLGLTTGLLDAALVGRVLKQLVVEGQPPSLLESYNEARRSAFLNHTNPVSKANRQRLISLEPDAIEERKQFFDKVNKPDIQFLIDMMEGEMSLSSTRD